MKYHLIKILCISLVAVSVLKCGSGHSDIIPTYSKNFYAITDVEFPGATKVMLFNHDHGLVRAFATLSKGKTSYTLLHPEKSICAVFYGNYDDTVAHFVLFDFKTDETLLEELNENFPVAGCFSPDGTYFVYTRKDVMHVYDIENAQLRRLAFDGTIMEHAFSASPQAEHAVVKVHNKKEITLVNMRTGVRDEIPGDDGWMPHGVAFGNKDDMLGITSLKDDVSSTQMLIWDIQAQKPQGSCAVKGIVSSGTILIPTQKMYFNPEDSWCLVNTFLPNKGNLQSYKIDLRSFKVVDTLTHSVNTQALFDVVNNRYAFITNDTVSVFDWDKHSVVKECTYNKPHFIVLNNDSSKVMIAYDQCRYAVEKI